MKEQVVNFKGYSIVHLEMNKNENEIKRENNELSLQIQPYQNSEDENTYKLVMKLSTISIKEKIDIEIEGYFEFKGNFEQEEIDTFLKINAASILYPYCRSIISSLTTLDSSEAVILPIINFSNIQQ